MVKILASEILRVLNVVYEKGEVPLNELSTLDSRLKSVRQESLFALPLDVFDRRLAQ